MPNVGPPTAEFVPSTPEGPVGPPAAMEVLRAWGVTRPLLGAYRLALKRVLPLLAAVAAVTVPAGVVASSAAVAIGGSHWLIVNDQLVAGTWSLSVAAAVAIGAVVVLLALATVTAAGAAVIVSAGYLLGSPVATRQALRAVARRPGTLASLTLILLLAIAAVAAIGIALLVWTGSAWLAIVGVVVAALALAPLELALPAALLEGRSALRAPLRALRLCRGRVAQRGWMLLLGTLVVPGLVMEAGRLAVSPLGGGLGAFAGELVTTALGTLVIALQAATLATVGLSQYWPFVTDPGPGDRADLVHVRERLPGQLGPTARSPHRRAWVLAAALVLPGLLYVGYTQLNPLSLVSLSDTVIRDNGVPEPVTLGLLGGREPVALIGWAYPRRTQVCADPACGSSTVHRQHFSFDAPGVEFGSVAMPGSELVVASWPSEGSAGRGLAATSLRVAACPRGVCPATAGRVLFKAAGQLDYRFSVAAAATRGPGGLLIAAAAPLPRGSGDTGIQLITCLDAACSTPHRVMVATEPLTSFGIAVRPLAIATNAAGRVLIAYEDTDSGAVSTITCASSRCRRPTVTQLRPAVSNSLAGDVFHPDGLTAALPPDGRGVIAYRDGLTGAARLLRCTTPACTSATTTTLTGPGARPWPALALDSAGRPMLATYDLAQARIELIACDEASCARRRATDLVSYDNGPGFVDLAVLPGDRPMLLWEDSYGSEFAPHSAVPLHLTTCRQARCGLRG